MRRARTVCCLQRARIPIMQCAEPRGLVVPANKTKQKKDVRRVNNSPACPCAEPKNLPTKKKKEKSVAAGLSYSRTAPDESGGSRRGSEEKAVLRALGGCRHVIICTARVDVGREDTPPSTRCASSTSPRGPSTGCPTTPPDCWPSSGG